MRLGDAAAGGTHRRATQLRRHLPSRASPAAQAPVQNCSAQLRLEQYRGTPLTETWWIGSFSTLAVINRCVDVREAVWAAVAAGVALPPRRGRRPGHAQPTTCPAGASYRTPSSTEAAAGRGVHAGVRASVLLLLLRGGRGRVGRHGALPARRRAAAAATAAVGAGPVTLGGEHEEAVTEAGCTDAERAGARRPRRCARKGRRCRRAASQHEVNFILFSLFSCHADLTMEPTDQKTE